MDWKDALIKILVGACLGFGIIALAKLFRSKINPDRRAAERAVSAQHRSGRGDGDSTS
jgi:hypothetical protein